MLSLIHMLLSSTKAIKDASKHKHAATEKQQQQLLIVLTVDLTTACRQNVCVCVPTQLSAQRDKSKYVTLVFIAMPSDKMRVRWMTYCH